MIGPTDTVYGIFADATNPDAIKKIFALKQRLEEKSLPIFVRDIKTARSYAYISDAKAKFLASVWPGAVTVVFHHKEKLPKVLTGGSAKIGIRIPDHPFILELLSRVDFPVAETSANISGKPAAKNIKEVKEYFGKSRVVLIDGGEVEGKQSTAVDLSGTEPIILRSGAISKAELDRFLESVR